MASRVYSIASVITQQPKPTPSTRWRLHS